MNIVLERHRIRSVTCDGKLYVNGMEVCDTAENTQHLLLPGEYRYLPLKVGNGVYNLHSGEILVGNYLMPGVVLHSRKTKRMLTERLRQAKLRGHTLRFFIK